MHAWAAAEEAAALQVPERAGWAAHRYAGPQELHDEGGVQACQRTASWIQSRHMVWLSESPSGRRDFRERLHGRARNTQTTHVTQALQCSHIVGMQQEVCASNKQCAQGALLFFQAA